MVGVGLSLFKVLDPLKPAPSKWKHLNMAIDQGGDGLAAMVWLFHWLINITFWLDFSHGAWRSIQGTISDLGLKSWWLLMLVMFNVPHGPWNDDFRFGQLTECWKEMRDHLAPELVPLFMACAPLMLDDVDHATKVALGSNWCKALWDDCLQEPPLQKKGYKVNQNRFFGGIKTAREDLKVYHKTQVVEEHAAIEGGMMPPRDIKMGPKQCQGESSTW